MNVDKRHRNMLDALMRKGIRITRQRMEIVRVLSHDRTHPSAGTILEKARKRAPGMSASTVYYTLGLLKKEGLIKELEFYDAENRYESEMTDHADLICTECGDIANLESVMPVTRRLKTLHDKGLKTWAFRNLPGSRPTECASSTMASAGSAGAKESRLFGS